MKLIYSQLKKFLPDLDKPIEKTADNLTLIGHLSEGIDEYKGEKFINLEIPKDRGDCLGYYGLAKELSVFYDLKLQIPKFKLPKSIKDKQPKISVSAEEQVLRLMAIEIGNITNKPSPEWLKRFLSIHEINSINTLVDLTNYIMLIYGIPCHAFDSRKISHQLEWKIADEKDKITTLDGTEIKIDKGCFLISDPKGTASLPVIGGRRTAIDLKTNQTLVEMAIYNPQKVRLDARKMNIITDASIRLEKELDTELIPQPFNHLVSLIQENCGGKIISQPFDYYPNKPNQPTIKFDPQKPTKYAGTNIPTELGLDILKKLDCQVKQINKDYRIIPPTLRKDLKLEEDLIEEVIRFYGYNKIPINEPISSENLADIAPKIIYLIESVKNILINLGYDEIRSWPIIRTENLHKPKYLSENAEPIYTENNVNSEYPLLRMSLASSLYLQTIQSKKLKIPDQKFFEVGKVYYQKDNQYFEAYAVSFYQPNFNQLNKDAKSLLTRLKSENKQFSIEEINNKKFIEINLDELLKVISQTPDVKLNQQEKQTGKAIELTRQIIDFDANVVLDKKIEPEKLIKRYQKKIDPEILWKLEIIDIYQTKNNQYRYTFRAYYYNTTTAKAKKTHLKTFDLK